MAIRGGVQPRVLLSRYERASEMQRNYRDNNTMKMIAKLAIGAMMAGGVAVAAAAPAAAQVEFGLGVGPVAPVAPAYPSCYDVYGNYIYSYPYCTAYGNPGYVEPYVGVDPYVGIDPYWGWGGGYWGGGYWGGRDFDRGFAGRGFEGGRGFAGGRGFEGGRAFAGGRGFAGGRA